MSALRVLLVAAMILSGCVSHWQVQSAPPATVVQLSPGRDFLVTRADGVRVKLHEPAVLGDSLVGSTGPVVWPDTSRRVAVALADIRTLADRQPDRAASVAVGMLLTFAGIALVTGRVRGF